MQPAKERPLYSTNFACHRDAAVYSYDTKKKRSLVLLLSMHMMGEIDATETVKLEIKSIPTTKPKGGRCCGKNVG